MTYERKSKVVGDFMKPHRDRVEEQRRRVREGQLLLPAIPDQGERDPHQPDVDYTDHEAGAISAVLFAAAVWYQEHPCAVDGCPGCAYLVTGWDAVYRTLTERQREDLMDVLVEVGTRPPGIA